MNLYIKTLLVIGCFIKYSYAVTDFGPCTTANYEIARCIHIKECTRIHELLNGTEISVEKSKYLLRNQCGYRNNMVQVCCPKRFIDEEVVNQSNNPQQTNYVHPDLLPKAPNCGEALADHIVGGNITAMAEFPWIALLEYTLPDNKKDHICGGSIINEFYVITAAHCISAIPSGWRLTGVRLGEWNRVTNPDCILLRSGRLDCAEEYVYIPVAQAIPHPEFSQYSKHNDIALLRLQNRISFNEHNTIKPICLPYHDEQRDNLYVGKSMEVSGWGTTETEKYSNIKLKATVTVRDLQECSRINSNILHFANLQANQLCTGGMEGINSCPGDSGGSVAVLEKYGSYENYYLAGIVSIGLTPCGQRGKPSVNTRVGPYLTWIANTVHG